MPYESTFGDLTIDAKSRTPGGAETPFRIAVLADFSGRQGRATPGSSGEVLARKPVKVRHDSLDEAIESLEPRLEYSVAGGDVTVSLEFGEYDDFQPDPVARQVDRVSDLDDDDAKTALMREILHHPQYQALESAWRGLEWLLKRTQKADRIQVVLFDITFDELSADLMASNDLSQTAIHQLLIEKTAESPDGQPWAVVVGNFTFDETTDHAELLGRMAKIGARAGAPVLAGVTSKAAQESYEVPADGKPAWQALRELYESAYLGLATPGFLLRPPFGEEYRPAESFRFEEFSGTPDGYLWGNPAVACAGLLALGYMKSGWGFQPSQTLALDNMPMHTYRDVEGEAVAVCAEARFTSSVGEELAKRGFMPLLAVRGRDSVEFATIRPMSLEGKVLNGRWQGGQGGPPATSGVPKVSVGMMSKGQTSGRAAPNREGPAFVSAEPSQRAAPRQEDPETDPDLAALLAGDEVPSDEPPPQDASDSPPPDATEESPPPEVDVALDPELAALLAGGGDEPPPEPEPELDPELAALLAGTTEEAPPAEEAPAEELDPELAALLGETPGPPAENGDAEALDPDLAALLGDTPAAESEPAAAEETPPADDEVPAMEDEVPSMSDEVPSMGDEIPSDDEVPSEEPAAMEELDPDLAALLGGDAPDEEAAAEPEAVTSNGDELDPDLAALLGDSTQPTEEFEATPEPEPAASDELDPDLAALLGESPAAESTPAEDELPSFDEPTAEESPIAEPQPEPEPAMATVTDERPDLAGEDDFSASPATRSASAMAQDLDSLIQQVQDVSKFGSPGAGSPPVIDFKSLVAPISDEEPAGGGVPFDVREKLEQARKEVNPDAFAPNDPLRPTDAVKADWTGIIALSQETLRNTSKNLLVAARLLEALTKKHGPVGLRDGLHLMRLLVEICWDRLDPPLEDEDMEVRAGPFNWLDDPDRGAVFPNSIRALPILAADGNSFSWQQWQQSQGGGGQDVIDKVIMAAPRDRCQALVDNLTQAQQELRFLMQTLSEKMGPDAPGFTVMRPAMSDVLKLAQGILQKKGPPPDAGEEGTGTELSITDGSGQTVVVMQKPRMSTREDIYQELATAASALERLEPHSPVPFLVRRAVELGALPFPLLMQALIRDASVLAEMNRELGIKQEAG